MIWLLLTTLAFATDSQKSSVDQLRATSVPPKIIGTITSPRVFFIEPKDGATVSRKFTARFGIQGMAIHPAGELLPGTGHHHLIINGKPIPRGQVIPMNDQHMHFGRGQNFAELKLKRGKYTLTLQFADGAHVSYGPEMSSTIKIRVK